MKRKTENSINPMIVEKLPAYFLLGLMFWVAWQLYFVVEPFLMVLIFSAIVATVTFPIYVRLEEALKGKKNLASVLTCLLVIFMIIIPILLFLLILAGQTVNLYKTVNTYLQGLDFNVLLSWKPGNFLYDLSGQYSTDVALLVQQNMDALKEGVATTAQAISKFAAAQSAKLLTDVGISIFNLLLMFFTLFFLYKDGRHLLRRLMVLSPMPIRHEKELFRKFNEISRAALFGTFLTAIAQGLVAWVGFSIAGVPSGFFWATAVSIFSLVPVVGTAAIWLPMGLFMLLSGNWWGLFILIWGAGLVSTLDNVLRVIFIGAASNLNPLLTFVAIFGGILSFGLIGVIFGPMLLVLFLTLLHVYELEYAEILDDGG